MRPVFEKGFTRQFMLIVKFEHVGDPVQSSNIRNIAWDFEIMLGSILGQSNLINHVNEYKKHKQLYTSYLLYKKNIPKLDIS